MLLTLKSKIIYGPVNSRRLGSSLGINLMPGKYKVCNFDCLYCQYGWTDFNRTQEIKKMALPGPDEVSRQLMAALKTSVHPPRYITFSGNGEPTLHPAFPEIVEQIIQIRDHFVPSARLAILSNSTTVSQPEINCALTKLDRRIMKLDAGNSHWLSNYNRPAPEISFQGIVAGLSSLQEVTIQSLFTSGPQGNYIGKHVKVWLKTLKEIGPVAVQLYSLDRDTPSRRISRVSKEQLGTLADQLRQEGLLAEVF